MRIRIALERARLWVQEDTQGFVHLEGGPVDPMKIGLRLRGEGRDRLFREERGAEIEESFEPYSGAFLWSSRFPETPPGRYELSAVYGDDESAPFPVEVRPVAPTRISMGAHEASWWNGSTLLRTRFVVDSESERIETREGGPEIPATPRPELTIPMHSIARSIVRTAPSGPPAALVQDTDGVWWLYRRRLVKIGRCEDELELAFSLDHEPVVIRIRKDLGFHIVRKM